MGEPKPPSYDATVSTPQAYSAYPPPQQPYPPQQQPYPPPQQPYPPQQQPYPPPQQPYGSTHDDQDSNIEYGGMSGKDDDTQGIISFNNQSVRLGFIRKVFAILILQMTATIVMMCWFIFHEPTKQFVQNNLGMYIAGYVIFLVLYFVLLCCTKVARKHPVNLILLAIFTISLSYMVAVISSFHDTKIVLALFGMTLLISAAVIGFASQTKFDFTKWGGVLFVAAFSLFIFGLFAAILIPTGYMRGLNVLYSGLGALLFMAFLAYDTQLIMGNKKYSINPEDYVFAAMMLYVDIIYIFLFLLSLFGGSN